MSTEKRPGVDLRGYHSLRLEVGLPQAALPQKADGIPVAGGVGVQRKGADLLLLAQVEGMAPWGLFYGLDGILEPTAGAGQALLSGEVEGDGVLIPSEVGGTT